MQPMIVRSCREKQNGSAPLSNSGGNNGMWYTFESIEAEELRGAIPMSAATPTSGDDDPEDEIVEDDLDDDLDDEDDLDLLDDEEDDDDLDDDLDDDDDDDDDDDFDDLDDDLVDLDDEYDIEDEERPRPGHPGKYDD